MLVAVAGENGVLAIVREWQVHAIVTGEIQIDSDSVLDNRHRSPICSAVPDIEDVFAGKVLSEEAAFHPPLVAAGGLGPDVPHRLPHSTKSGQNAICLGDCRRRGRYRRAVTAEDQLFESEGQTPPIMALPKLPRLGCVGQRKYNFRYRW